MPAPSPLPVRVLVKGSSSVVLTSWMGGPRTDFAYPRVIEQALLGRGRPVEVEVRAMTADKAEHALQEWRFEVIQWSPDVVVLHYGLVEAIHVVVPRWLERHANSMRKRPGPLRSPYRRLVLRPTYVGMAKAQTVVDRALGKPVLHRRLRRFEQTLERVVERVESMHHPLVLVPLLLPPGRLWDRWFPGCAARIAATNAAITALVARRAHPDVRVFDTFEALASLGAAPDEDLTPDGGHFTPEAHRVVGEAMADVIAEWADGQPHLQPALKGA